MCVCVEGTGSGWEIEAGKKLLQLWKLNCLHSLEVYCAIMCQALCKHWGFRNKSRFPSPMLLLIN